MTSQTVVPESYLDSFPTGKKRSRLTATDTVKLALSLRDNGVATFSEDLVKGLRRAQLRGQQAWFWVIKTVLAAILAPVAVVGLWVVETRAEFKGWVIAAVSSIALSYITALWLRRAADDIAYIKLVLALVPTTLMMAIVIGTFSASVGAEGAYFYYMSIAATAGALVLGTLAVMHVPPMSLFFSTVVIGVFASFQVNRGLEGIIWVCFSLIYLVALNFMLMAWFRSLSIHIVVRETSLYRLRLIEDLWRHFERDSTDWIWEVDEHMRLLHVSSRMTELLGVGERELRGALLIDLFDATHPGTTVLHQQIRKRSEFRRIELRVLGDLELAWELSGRPVFNRHGELAGYRGVGSDITEHLALDRLRVAEERHRATSELIAGVAHDFNNLLQQVVANVGLIRVSQTASENDKAAATRATEAAIRAGNMTGQLLAYSRQEVLSPENIQLASVVRQIADSQLVATPVANFKLDIPDTLYVRADPELFGRALGNLLKNACEAAGSEGRVTVFASREVSPKSAKFVSLRISDSGDGFDDESLAKATEPFYSTKRARGGVGLGLSLVSGFARQSNGALKLANNIAGGAAVTLTLPAAQHTVGVAPVHGSQSFGEIGGTILVCEDNESVGHALSEQLQSKGMQVTVAANLQSAIALANDRSFDFALVDLMLSDGSGLVLVQMLEATSTKVVVMTGYRGLENTSQIAGKIVLRKPFPLTELVQQLR